MGFGWASVGLIWEWTAMGMGQPTQNQIPCGAHVGFYEPGWATTKLSQSPVDWIPIPSGSPGSTEGASFVYDWQIIPVCKNHTVNFFG